MPKKKRGRPAKATGDLRNRLVKTTVTAGEYEELAAAAKRADRALADWIRLAGLREARKAGAE